jgi:hypothetical protein
MTFVQAWRNDRGAAGTNLTVGINPSAGRVLVIHVAYESTVTDNVTLTDPSDPTGLYVRALNGANATQVHHATCFYILSSVAGSRTLTINFGASRANSSVRVEEHSGLSAFIAASTINYQTAPTTGAGATTSGNINVTSQPAWLIGCSKNWGAGTPPPAVANGNDNGSAFDYLGADYARFSDRRVTATGNQALTFTAPANVVHITYALAFTEAAGGPTITDRSGTSTLTFAASLANLGGLRNAGGSSSLSLSPSARLNGLASITNLLRPSGSAYLGQNAASQHDYILQETLPVGWGDDEWELECWVRLDNSFPVGATTDDTPGQLTNWAQEDATPLSSSSWWYKGNFLLDGFNNNTIRNGSIGLQVYGAGRIRATIGDGVARTGDVLPIQAAVTANTPSLLDALWHKLHLCRRRNGSGSLYELRIDRTLVASNTSAVFPTFYTTWWGSWAGFLEAGFIWGAEKQAAFLNNGMTQYEDFKGWIKDIVLREGARSGIEIEATWNRRVQPTDPGVVGLYRFSEGSGTTVDNAASGSSTTDLEFVRNVTWSTQSPTFYDAGILFDVDGSLTSAPRNIAGSAAVSFGYAARLGAYVAAIGSTSLAFDVDGSIAAGTGLSATASLSFASAGVLSALAQGAGSAALTLAVAASLQAYGAAQGSSALTFTSAGALRAYGSVQGSTSYTFSVSGRLSAYGGMLGASTLSFDSEGSFQPDGDVRGATSLTFAGLGSLTALAVLRGTSTLAFDVSASTSSGINIGGSTSLSFTVDGRAAATRNAQGAGTLSFATSALLSAHANAVGRAEFSFTVNGRMVAYASLRGQSSMLFSTSAGLASPFIPGVVMFAVPIELSEYAISL